MLGRNEKVGIKKRVGCRDDCRSVEQEGSELIERQVFLGNLKIFINNKPYSLLQYYLPRGSDQYYLVIWGLEIFELQVTGWEMWLLMKNRKLDISEDREVKGMYKQEKRAENDNRANY